MSNEELVQLYQNGDKKALDKLIQANAGIIHKIANKYNGINRELEFDDLFQSGVLGFIAAAKKYKFDIEKRARFITFAVYYIDRYIHSCVNGRTTKDMENNKFYHQCTSLNKTTGEEEELEIGDNVADDELGFENIEDKLFIANLRKELEKVMQEKNTLEQREVLKLRYGWNSKPMTLNEIAEIFNITGNKARLTESAALRRLRNSMWAKKNMRMFGELGYIDRFYLGIFNRLERLYCD
ncbi:MAG: sigma-70 family RNA polymerase sigma factor [Clostridium celatum]|nr:sigma-70 family RNA polymerase sigma factor [Clostridium celatum]